MHPDAVYVGCFSGLVPGVEDLLERLSGAWIWKEVMTLPRHLVIALFHLQ